MKTSDNIDKLVPALILARAQLVQPKMDGTASTGKYSYKYATLSAVTTSVDAAIKGTGLAFTQDITSDEANHTVSVTTGVWEKSGQYIIFGPLTMHSEKPNAQGDGSAISYARRYSLSAAFGVVADSDDDGQSASQNYGDRHQQKQPQQSPAKNSGKTMTQEEAITKEVSKYAALVNAAPDDVYQTIINKLKLPNKPVKSLTYDQAREIYNWIEAQIAGINKATNDDNGSH